MKNYDNKLLIVIPFYNEQKRGSKFCEQLFKELDNDFSNFIFYLIDDCSSDDTYLELLTFSKKYEKNVVLVKNNINRGHGPSVVSGYQYGLENLYDYVVQIDGDNSAEPWSIASASFIPDIPIEPASMPRAPPIVSFRSFAVVLRLL